MATMGDAKRIFDAMPGAGDVVSAVGSDLMNKGKKLGESAAKAVYAKFGDKNDRIEIPEGTKTLTGDDFSVLLPGASSGSVYTSDGEKVKTIEASSEYETEMHSGNLASSVSRSIDTLTKEQRVAFEVVLLSKKYAAEYQEGDAEANDAAADEYTSCMTNYRSLCENDGTNWNEVMNYASWELQQQSFEFTEREQTSWRPGDAQNERILVNRAHGMLIECGGEGWQDSLYPAFGGKNYEDTLDTSVHTDVGFFKNIGKWFNEKWEGVKSFFTAPWRGIKAAVIGIAAKDASDNIDRAIESGDRAKIDQAVKDGQSIVDAVYGKDESAPKSNKSLEGLDIPEQTEELSDGIDFQ